MLIFATALASGPPAETIVHAGDTVAVTVFNHPELSGPVVVDASGFVAVPLAGEVEARDATVRRIAERLEVRLRRFVPLAYVEVRVVQQAQQLFVTGSRSGTLKYAPGETLSAALQDIQNRPGAVMGTGDAADLAHGPIDLRKVTLVRNGAQVGSYDVASMTARGDDGPALFPGDTIQLRNKALAVAVRGEVHQPGTAYLDEHDPLAQAIAQSGGALDDAWLSKAVLLRDGSRIEAALGDRVFSEPAQPGDVIELLKAPRVAVLGLVAKPGVAVLQGDGTLMEALYEAGGPITNGNLRSVAVLHRGVRTEYDLTRLQHGAPAVNPTLADGDTVFVPQGHRIDFTGFFSALSAAWYVIHL